MLALPARRADDSAQPTFLERSRKEDLQSSFREGERCDSPLVLSLGRCCGDLEHLNQPGSQTLGGVWRMPGGLFD